MAREAWNLGGDETAMANAIERRRVTKRGVAAGLTQGIGRISRRIEHDIQVPAIASAGVRRLSGLFLHRGVFLYRDSYGHVNEADLSDYMERSGFFGAHSPKLLRYIASVLRPGDWAIDIGANVGLVSSPMAAAVGHGGRVSAVEPLARNIQRLEAFQKVNGLRQLEVIPVALGSTKSTARLRLSSLPGGSGTGSFVAPWAREEYVEVPTTTLDAVVEERRSDKPLRLIKMDVEGYEGEVVAGGERTFKELRPFVLCELHDRLLRAAGLSAEGLLRMFAGMGYGPRSPFLPPRGSLEGTVSDVLLVPEGG